MVDTIAHVAPEDAGQVVVCGSHGGVSSGEYAARVPVAACSSTTPAAARTTPAAPRCPISTARGIAAGTVAHDSAMIGDALETFESGVISAVNERAQAAGFAVGRPLREAIREVLGRGHA